jgi:hypothetical protein
VMDLGIREEWRLQQSYFAQEDALTLSVFI